jgi:DNA adenine methylase
LLKDIESTKAKIANVQFTNCDFRDMLAKIQFKQDAFIYCDPPYVGTVDNYSHSFTKKDSIDLFDMLCKSGQQFAYSEFDTPFIIEQAKSRGLYVNYIKARKTISNRNTEILITNYHKQTNLFEQCT